METLTSSDAEQIATLEQTTLSQMKIIVYREYLKHGQFRSVINYTFRQVFEELKSKDYSDLKCALEWRKKMLEQYCNLHGIVLYSTLSEVQVGDGIIAYLKGPRARCLYNFVVKAINPDGSYKVVYDYSNGSGEELTLTLAKRDFILGIRCKSHKQLKSQKFYIFNTDGNE